MSLPAVKIKSYQCESHSLRQYAHNILSSVLLKLTCKFSEVLATLLSNLMYCRSARIITGLLRCQLTSFVRYLDIIINAGTINWAHSQKRCFRDSYHDNPLNI